MSSNENPFVEKLNAIGQLVKADLRPLPPRWGDGRYDSDVSPQTIKTGILKDLTSQAFRVPADIDLIVDAVKVLLNGGLQNDADYFMEKIVQFVASLPDTSKSSAKITDGFISNLWNVLHHPPLSYLGDKYQYRNAEGADNNIMYPHLGKSATAYAKSVKPVHIQPAALPDAGILFDTILARKKYIPHPNKISSMLFYQATVIIHDLFRTNHQDPNISDTSSYLDLAPLYGSNQQEQDAVRTHVDGKLKPDAFSEERILGFPPGVSVLMISYNRFHNYVVQELAAINEGGRFTKPDYEMIKRMVKATSKPSVSDADVETEAKKRFNAKLAKRDNDLFQTGRLVTCGLYVNVILYDYVRTILGLNRTNDLWNLDPRAAGPHVYSTEGTPIGVGNQVSCEFNLLYRWHAAISDRDDKWTQEFLYKLFPGKDIFKLSLEEFRIGLTTWLANVDEDPGKRTLDMGTIKRGEDGTFDDSVLMKILTESIEDCAASFASGVPLALKLVEVMGIQQARYWKMATLNELRRFLGLIEHKSFEAINPDPVIARSLRQLYDHPDNVEMYPGLVFEYTKEPMVPGSGLCPPQTIGKAILSDAVALVRGDRFYTVDYTPANLTHFGFTLASSDPDVAQGGVLYKLFMRAFPGWFEYNSVYANFPLTIPSENKQILTKLGQMSRFSLTKPTKPKPDIIFSTAENAKRILGDQKTFKVIWGAAISRLSHGVDFMLSADRPANTEQHKAVYKVLYTDAKHGMDEVWDFYTRYTEKLLAERSYQLGDFYQVDAVREIMNMVHCHFTAQLFNLPLKDEEHPNNPFTEKQLYDILALLFGYVFLDRDETASFKIRMVAAKACEALATLVKVNVTAVSLGGWVKKVTDGIREDGFLDSYGNNFIRKLLDAGKPIEEIIWIIMPTAAAGTANQGQQSIQMLDLLLSKDYIHHWPEIVRLANCDDEPSRKKLRAYALEACRLSTQSFGLFRRVDAKVTVEEGGIKHDLNPGDEIFVNLVGANVDPVAYPNPKEIRFDRPESSYVNYGWGPHICIGKEINIVANTAILRAFARLPNLRRAPGPQGELKYVIKNNVVKAFMQEDWSNYWFFPTTMKVHFDAKK